MFKDKHLKMYIDRLMLVPRTPLEVAHEGEHGKNAPIDHAGAKLPNPKTMDMLPDPMKDLDGAEDHADHVALTDRDTLHKGDDMDDDEDAGTHGKSHKMDHKMDKGENLSAGDHETKVKMERARHKRIFGD